MSIDTGWPSIAASADAADAPPEHAKAVNHRAAVGANERRRCRHPRTPARELQVHLVAIPVPGGTTLKLLNAFPHREVYRAWFRSPCRRP